MPVPLTAPAELALEARAGVVRLTLQRPQKRNALSHSLLAELSRALDAVAADPAARAVVLAAAGPVFCSGHDLGDMLGRSEHEYHELFSLCSTVMQQLRRLPQPVIARVHGPAFAAGCQLVAACDLAVAAESATFATPGVKIGLFCSTPMVPVSRAVGRKRAMEMLLTGEPISARTAAEWGLVNRVVPDEELDAALDELIARITGYSRLVTEIGKRAFYAQVDLSEEGAYEVTRAVMASNASLDDAQEGMGAFVGKRPPAWTNT